MSGEPVETHAAPDGGTPAAVAPEPDPRRWKALWVCLVGALDLRGRRRRGRATSTT
ncbi:hypothetical protein [Terrabacter sp. Soil810]|uniref:hypothetical protein n=1 Tax=Terrabacter sp. Soil810 TaxID=1736418 RepID=UPI000AE5C3C6|nr:hypothetical protein [Terrabacter sp. Soil810]